MTYSLLLDTSSLMYRAYFALPASLVDQAGHPVNAVRGYLDMVARIASDYRPDRVIHIYDHDWRPAPRVTVYAGYKAQRPPDPDGLPEQFDLLREVLDALGALQAEAPSWEADDAIGTLCARAEAGDRVDIVTGDRDLLQLVRDGKGQAAVRVLFTVKGVGELAAFDEAAVVEKYGVPAQRYADFATLRGDPSDGLPGVKGIGEKTARSLVERYPTLEALMADLEAQPPKLAASLREAQSYLAAMRSVVPVRTDVEVRLFGGTRDEARLQELQTAGNLDSPIKRLLKAGT
jgi:5'-3' exonuclease